MVYSINFRNAVFLLPFGIVLACIGVSQSTLFLSDPARLSQAITFDLLITTPVFYYLIIRKRQIPKTTVVPVFIIGIVIASIILPAEHQQYLSLVKNWFLPFLELAIITYLIVSVRKAIRRFRQKEAGTPDFFTATKEAAAQILPPRLSTAFATELSLFYYGFVHWSSLTLNPHEFSYHRTTSTRLVLGVFVFLIIIEAFAVHLLVQSYSTVTAWILTILSIYALLQMVGILKSISKRPVAIESDRLILRYSVLNEVVIPLNQIEGIKYDTATPEKSNALVFLSPFKDMEGTNIIIEAKAPLELVGFYGFKKSFERIALYLDEPKLFVEKLNTVITPSH